MKKCPVCNSTFDDSQIFCLVDGKELVADIEPTILFSSLEETPKKMRGFILPLFAAVFGLVVFGIGGWFIYNLVTNTNRETPARADKPNIPANKPEPTATPLPTATPTPIEAVTISETNTSAETANFNGASANKNPAAKPAASNSSGETTKPENPTSPESIRQIEENGLLMAAKQCRKSTTIVICEVSITNKTESDIVLKIYAEGNRLFDEFGNNYKSESVQLANKSGYSPEIKLVTGVTTTAQITFDEINEKATQVKLLDFRYYVNDKNEQKGEFRNFALMSSNSSIKTK